ncbi:uroporphyrinogen-III synthase [Helicobacter hepaticus]|jgi:uroporphyrinogen-III synthase|uniref:Uroporphyrinogen-III synthase HemD n=1 Tax=Helicobacter hepaticus (strain ATCC 51449 / 3B1) TaxID=235279 RepID=Q7VJY8_HELHP|nr:uroporphyrinogen-III synthase [Helicobacter hepaticus]AAP76701.1 uroporphyrinogen-III synthase HemD [Helicobacter hepaticus ATCC 51449]
MTDSKLNDKDMQNADAIYEVVLVGTRAHQGVKSLISNVIESIPITHTLKGIDALIFTSSYAITSLIESASPKSISYNPNLAHWREIPSFVISPSSAALLHKENASIAFVGKKAHGKEFAKEIIPLLQGRTPLYLRAQKIISGLDSLLKNANIPLQEAIAYINHSQILPPSLKPKPKSVLIFSAPSAYESFITNFGWDSHYVAVAIGRSTFAHFEEGINAYISPIPTISSCIDFARSLAQKLNTSSL